MSYMTKGHYARVCMSKNRPLSSRVAALPESFLASVVGAPPSLQAAVIDVEVDKLPARALLDTGATESYIHEELVKLKLKSQGELSRISLASVGTSARFCSCPGKSVQPLVRTENGRCARTLC